MYDLVLRLSVEKKFRKLAKKDPKKLNLIGNKIDEVLQEPHRYKNLRSPLNHLKRVHIDKSFVLIFSADDDEKLVIIKNTNIMTMFIFNRKIMGEINKCARDVIFAVSRGWIIV